MFFAFLASRVCVASTCSTSLSPQTTVMPGRVAPFSGPITCTMPWRWDMKGKKAAAPNSAMLLSSVVICSLLIGSVMPS